MGLLLTFERIAGIIMFLSFRHPQLSWIEHLIAVQKVGRSNRSGCAIKIPNKSIRYRVSLLSQDCCSNRFVTNLSQSIPTILVIKNDLLVPFGTFHLPVIAIILQVLSCYFLALSVTKMLNGLIKILNLFILYNKSSGIHIILSIIS